MSRRLPLIVASGLLSLLPVSAAGPPRPVWLCVGSEEFLQAAEPLIAHRRTQNLTVKTAAGPVKEAVAACQPPPQYIVLLGDDVPGEAADAPPWRVPAERRPFHGWLDWHPKYFASDMAYGDLDGDGLPDASAGRIPARKAPEIQAAAEKIIRWEKRALTLADLSVPVWAGDPGFGQIFKDMALGFLFLQVQQRAPRWAEIWLLQGDERSPYCGWPVEQPALFNARLQQGGIVSAMIGHGDPRSWWSMDLGNRRLLYSTKDAARNAGEAVSPPHIIFACSCGSYAMKDGDSLAEALFRAPAGPVLCVAASEDSHPLTNYYHSTALLDLLGSGPRFGDLWLRSLRKAHQTTEPEKEILVHALEPLMIKKRLKTEDLRADHAMLYNIIGDPATKVFTPGALAAEIIEKEGRWHWRVSTRPPGAKKLLVQFRDPLPAATLLKPLDSRETALRTLEEANSRLRFRTLKELTPEDAWEGEVVGAGTLRLVAEGDTLAVAAVTSSDVGTPAAAGPK